MANLSALLEKEASAEIEAILSEARARASEIVADAKAEAESALAQQERAAKAQYEAALVRAKSSAQLEASALRLRAQHQAVEGVWTALGAEIEALTKDAARYEKVLSGLLEEALSALGGKDAVQAVLVNPADKALAEKVAARRGVAEKLGTDASVSAGVRVRAASGNVALENTLHGRLESLKSELASEISRVLFGKGA